MGTAISEVDGDGAVRGVLEGELATLGDPLRDLGSTLTSWVTDDDWLSYEVLEGRCRRLIGLPEVS